MKSWPANNAQVPRDRVPFAQATQEIRANGSAMHWHWASW